MYKSCCVSHCVVKCRDIADRAFKVVQREAERHSAVRSQLASLEGLQAAALFQEGLKEPLSPGQTPSIGVNCIFEFGPKASIRSLLT